MSFVGSLDTVTDDSGPVDVLKGIQPQLEPLIRNLERALRIDQERFSELDAYYNGAHPHSFDSVRFQQAFGKQLRRFADNWMRMVVKVTADRLVVQGFRVGSGDDTDAADDAAWKIWQANRLDASSVMAHREAMKYGVCFLMVDPFDKDGNRLEGNRSPRITVESPMQVVGQRDAQDRYQLINAIKKWIGDDDHLYLNLYLPEVVYKYRSTAPAPSALPNDEGRLLQQVNWAQYGEVENPLGVVPIVPMENCPDLILGGRSDLDDLIPLNDGLNKVLRDMLVTSEYQAFQQRVIIGAEVPKDPTTGKPMTENQVQLMASRSRAWLFPNPNTKVESLAQVDLTPYTAAVDLFIHHLSMISQTPAYMLVGKMANLSADAIRAAELGFVGKLQTKQTDFGVAWERAEGLALRAAENASADDVIETIWKDAAANSGSILSNELVQMSSVGVPQEILWERWGASPQDVERWRRMAPVPVERVAAGGAAKTSSAQSRTLTDGSAPDGQASDGTVTDS
jgi:hypothetical protein